MQAVAAYHVAMKVIGIAGYSGSGKTTLIEKLIPVLVREGLRVSLVKHAHHEFDVDQPGKDSWRHRHAGCTEVLVSSSKRWALMHELRGAAGALAAGAAEAPVALRPGDRRGLQERADPQGRGAPPRRPQRRCCYPEDPHVVAVATDEPLETRLPQFGIDDVEAMARFIVRFLALDRARLGVVR